MKIYKECKVKSAGLMVMLFLLVLTATGQANALSLVTSSNISENMYVNNSTIAGKFDITSQIPTNGQYRTPYSVNSAYAVFTFEDDINDHSYGSYTSEYSYSHGDTFTKVYVRYHWNYIHNESESVTLNMAGQYSYNATEWFNMIAYNGQDYNGGHPHFEGFIFWVPFFDWHDLYTINQTQESGYKGTITIIQNFGDAALGALADDGKIDFSLAVEGDLNFKSGYLYSEIVPNPQTAVPEPATMLLLAFGLAGLAGARKALRK